VTGYVQGGDQDASGVTHGEPIDKAHADAGEARQRERGSPVRHIGLWVVVLTLWPALVGYAVSRATARAAAAAVSRRRCEGGWRGSREPVFPVDDGRRRLSAEHGPGVALA